eukprot:2574800-Prymnesium_polylepis.2
MPTSPFCDVPMSSRQSISDCVSLCAASVWPLLLHTRPFARRGSVGSNMNRSGFALLAILALLRATHLTMCASKAAISTPNDCTDDSAALRICESTKRPVESLTSHAIEVMALTALVT